MKGNINSNIWAALHNPGTKDFSIRMLAPDALSMARAKKRKRSVARGADVGAAALDAGGNAADAAVATAQCQGVHNPMASVRDGEEEGGLERESFIFFFFSSFLPPTHPPTPSSLHRA